MTVAPSISSECDTPERHYLNVSALVSWKTNEVLLQAFCVGKKTRVSLQDTQINLSLGFALYFPFLFYLKSNDIVRLDMSEYRGNGEEHCVI